MKLSVLFYSLVLITTLTQCTSSTNTTTPLLGQSVREEWGNCEEESSNGSTIRIDYWAPDIPAIKEQLFQLTQEALLSVIDSAQIAQTPQITTHREAAFNAFGNSYKEAKQFAPDMPGCWEVNITGDTLYRTNEFITYEITKYSYTGGAHPNTFVALHMFELATGKELTSTDFIQDRNALLPLVEQGFRQNQDLQPNENLAEAGYFLDANDQFFLPSQMVLTKDGLLCYYNPYEIAAYAYGPIEFVIPYSSLKKVLAPGF